MKKFNKILSWILVVVMVVSMCPLTAFAAESTVKATVKNASYADGVLTVDLEWSGLYFEDVTDAKVFVLMSDIAVDGEVLTVKPTVTAGNNVMAAEVHIGNGYLQTMINYANITSDADVASVTLAYDVALDVGEHTVSVVAGSNGWGMIMSENMVTITDVATTSATVTVGGGTETPTEEPTEAPSEEPTEEPTEAPTEEPTEAPTEEPTEAPTEEPTEAPTEAPEEESSVDTSWYNADETTFTITTAAQLAGLAQLVDEGNTFEGKTVLLGNDIDLEGSEENPWNPIGSVIYSETLGDMYASCGVDTYIHSAAEGSAYFAGTFDGQDHTVSGLYIKTSGHGLALFAFNTGTVKNLTVNGSVTNTAASYDSEYMIAGIVALNRGTVSDCVNNADVSAPKALIIGGVVGHNDGYNDGKGAPALVTRCVNNGKIYGYQYMAGIAAENAGLVSYSVNNGFINNSSDGFKEQTGGIVARNGHSNITTGTIIGCYNTGLIDGNKRVGGISGFNAPSSFVYDSYDLGKVVCYNTGNPIVGHNEGKVYNSYYLNTMKVWDESGVYNYDGNATSVNCGPKTEAELKDAAFLSLINPAFVADSAESPINNGYPVLYWQRGLTMGTVSVDKSITFGELTVNAAAVAEGNTVSVSVRAEKNYALKSISYTTDGETYTALTATEDASVYTFVMPKGDVTVTAEFSYTGAYWDGTTIDTAWYNTEDTVFIINTPTELAGLAAIVNGTAEGIAQDTFEGKTVQLGGNIALGENGLYETVENVTYGGSGYTLTTTQYYLKEAAPVWTPIGSGSATSNTNASGNVFAGTFDGKGYAITGLYTGTKDGTSGNTDTVQGLFGIVSGTIQNLTVSGCVTGKIVVGGIVANLNGGTIVNCANKAIVFADGGTTPNGGVEDGVSSGGAVGGIVGNVAGTASVTKCKNYGHVLCLDTNKGGRVGGIIGLIDSDSCVVTISENSNTGTVEGYQYAGGIVGLIYSANSPVDRCYNGGRIVGHGIQKVHTGGIVGTYASQISNCYNTGDVYLAYTAYSAYSGGVAGDYASGRTAPAIINCYNTGVVDIKGSGGSRSFGIIVGAGGEIRNCYYLDTALENGSSSANGTAKTAAELKDAAFLELINVDNLGAFVSDDSANPINNGFPVLGWQLGVAEPIAVSSKYEGEFKYEYIQNQKFSIGSFKIYNIYNNDDVLETKEYQVYLDGELLDTASYAFDMDDNGKTLKVTWTANGTEVNYVEQTVVVTLDKLTGFLMNAGSPKLSYYFVGDTLDISSLVKVGYYRSSGVSLYLEGEAMDALEWYAECDNGVILSVDGALTAEHNGATLKMAYTYNDSTIVKSWGKLVVMEDKQPVDGYYQLKTAEDVYWFGVKVNCGAKDANAILLRHIDLTGITMPTMSDYEGTFDGNGKSLNIKTPLFNSITTGTVKNLTVTGSVSGGTTGAIVKTIKGAATIENCVNKANVNSGSRGTNIGGIVGTISADASGAKITRCVNYGAITLNGGWSYYAGGIAGRVDCADVTISECVNAGTVKGSTYFTNNAGGIVGVNAGTVTNCYNMAAVSVTQHSGTHAGGIVGNNSGTISNCYSTGAVSSQRDPKGAIAGGNSGTVTNCYALTDSCANLVGGGTIDEASAFKTEEELKAADMLTLLGEAYAEDTDCPALFDGYPVLAWQIVNGHRYEITVVAPTCDEFGYTVHTCPGCGDSYTDEMIPAQHSYKGVITKRTCTTEGFTTYTCTGCGDTYVDEIIAPHRPQLRVRRDRAHLHRSGLHHLHLRLRRQLRR